jgi:hypothetical protein
MALLLLEARLERGVSAREERLKAEGDDYRALNCSPDIANIVIPARPGCLASPRHATVLMTLFGDIIARFCSASGLLHTQRLHILESALHMSF